MKRKMRLDGQQSAHRYAAAFTQALADGLGVNEAAAAAFGQISKDLLRAGREVALESCRLRLSTREERSGTSKGKAASKRGEKVTCCPLLRSLA